MNERTFWSFLFGTGGQSMMEYAGIAILVVLVAIGAWKALGNIIVVKVSEIVHGFGG